MSAVWPPGSLSATHRRAANAASMVALSSLVYQSRATSPISDDELQRLVASAQIRNRSEGVTGLLIHDQDRFLQWLEGPAEGLGRIWQSIRNDSRHTAVTLLGESTTPVRLFGGSPMALGQRRDDGEGGSERRNGVGRSADLIDTLVRSLQDAPSMPGGTAAHPFEQVLKHDARVVNATRLSLQSVVGSVIVPALLARHSVPVLMPVVMDPRAAELARLLVATAPKAAFALIDSLRADGRSILELCAGLFEPAARALGDLWLSDDCSDFDVSLGLAHLRAALRRISVDASFTDVPRLFLAEPHAVLVAPSPREPHLLGSAIASEMFWRAGWDVRCEFPDSDAALNRLVHDRWFDVLDLSLSAAYSREHRLPAMAASIRAARAHSLNPALTVIVDGRVFHERPEADAEVSADDSAPGAEGLVSAALNQMQRRQREGQQQGQQEGQRMGQGRAEGEAKKSRSASGSS